MLLPYKNLKNLSKNVLNTRQWQFYQNGSFPKNSQLFSGVENSESKNSYGVAIIIDYKKKARPLLTPSPFSRCFSWFCTSAHPIYKYVYPAWIKFRIAVAQHQQYYGTNNSILAAGTLVQKSAIYSSLPSHTSGFELGRQCWVLLQIGT
jgi:hypothetical protein